MFVSERCLYLTPRLFERLDQLAWEHACKPMAVFDLDERRSGILQPMDWAHCSPARGSVYSSGREMAFTETTVMEIANKIPLGEIRAAKRLELDLVRDIPLDSLYEWLVWHEIHHSVHEDPIVAASLDMEGHPRIKTAGDRIKLMQAMELEADRDSFNRLFPGHTPAARTGEGIKKVRKIEPYLVLLHEIREQRGKKEAAPLYVIPGEYGSAIHFMEDITWAKEVKSLMDMADNLNSDGWGDRILGFQEQIQEGGK